MKPIIFSTPMVQAILDGRKTMTRRVVMPQPAFEQVYEYRGKVLRDAAERTWCYKNHVSPDPWNEIGWIEQFARFQPGDVLWVRETWNADWCDHVIYKADGGSAKAAGYTAEPKWHPSIHMPRAAARIFLRVTDVRVERVQEMPLFDVWSEGTPQMPRNTDTDGAVNHEDFKYLWGSINAKRGYGWAANPWVWVISFERISEKDVERAGEGEPLWQKRPNLAAPISAEKSAKVRPDGAGEKSMTDMERIEAIRERCRQAKQVAGTLFVRKLIGQVTLLKLLAPSEDASFLLGLLSARDAEIEQLKKGV